MEVVNDWLSESREIAKTVAYKIHRRYHTYFDVSDVSQELLVWILKRQDKIQEWLDHPLDSEEYKRGVRKLAKTLTRNADKYCRKMKAQFLGYEIRDEQYYSPITLSELLPFVWSDVVETRAADGEKVSGMGNPAEGGNYIIQLFDVRRALDKLDPSDRLVLQMKFFEMLTFSEIAHTLEVSDTTAHRKVDGALRRLNNQLGGQSPFKEEVEM